MNQIYFAGPMFSDAELTFNASLTFELEILGYDVFLPQRDGVEASKPPYDLMSRDERRAATFALDRDQVMDCDIFLFVLDGRVPDEGACVELGMAYADKLKDKPERLIIGLHTDLRAAFIMGKLNPVLGECFDVVLESKEALLAFLEEQMDIVQSA